MESKIERYSSEWYGLHVDEKLGGWNVIIRCPVCHNSVFTGSAKDKDRAIKAVEKKFNEVHLECNYNSSSAGESSAV